MVADSMENGLRGKGQMDQKTVPLKAIDVFSIEDDPPSGGNHATVTGSNTFHDCLLRRSE